MDITNTENLSPRRWALTLTSSIDLKPSDESSAFWICVSSVKKLPGSS